MPKTTKIINVPFRREGENKLRLYDWDMKAIRKELREHGLPSSESTIYAYFGELRKHSALFRAEEAAQRYRTGNNQRLNTKSLFQVWALITFTTWVHKCFSYLGAAQQRKDAAVSRLTTEELPTSAFFEEFPDYAFSLDQGDDFLKAA